MINKNNGLSNISNIYSCFINYTTKVMKSKVKIN